MKRQTSRKAPRRAVVCAHQVPAGTGAREDRWPWYAEWLEAPGDCWQKLELLAQAVNDALFQLEGLIPPNLAPCLLVDGREPTVAEMARFARYVREAQARDAEAGVAKQPGPTPAPSPTPPPLPAAPTRLYVGEPCIVAGAVVGEIHDRDAWGRYWNRSDEWSTNRRVVALDQAGRLCFELRDFDEAVRDDQLPVVVRKLRPESGAARAEG